MGVLSFFPSSWHRDCQSQPSNPFQNGLEQLSGKSHLCHLEDDLPGMPRDLRSNLDQFLPQRRQCSVTHYLRQHRLPPEVAQLVGRHEQLPPHLIVHQVMAGHPRPRRAIST